MSDGGKSKGGPKGGPKGGKAKNRNARAAAAKRPPAETAKPDPDKPSPKAGAADDGPAAPVGFSSRDTVGDGKPPAAAGKAGGARVAVLLAAAVAVVAVAGYLTRNAWLPSRGVKPAAVAAKPAAKPEPAAKPAAAPADAAKAAADAQAFEKLTKERERLQGELDRLIARLDSVEKSMDTAKKMVRATAPPEEKVTGQPSLQKLNERVEALEKREAALQDLAKRVDKMEKDAAAGGGEGGARAMVLAVAGLRDAVARGEPFAAHLEALKSVAGGDPDVKAMVALLAKGGEAGIPTLAVLRERFDALAGRIVRASKTGDGGSWMARAADRISSLITWRRVGDGAAGGSVDALVAHAETRLKAGDLAGAVKALDGLAGDKKAAAAAEAWLADAKARLTAERAVASLHLHAVSRLSPAKQ